MNLDYLTAARYFKMLNDNAATQDQLASSFSPNQISSKMWMLEELDRCVGDAIIDEVEIIGSWFGWPLIDMMEKQPRLEFKHYTLWDIDQSARVICRKYATLFGMEDRVNCIGRDYWNHDRTGSDCGLIINTSSEHMVHSFDKLKEYGNPFYDNDPVVVVQSNNMYEIEDHVNCCDHEDELVDIHGFSDVMYKGSQAINDLSIKDTEPRKRFMVIGKIR